MWFNLPRHVVMAKSRLVPIKPLIISRLELQTATLVGTRQDSLLRRELGIDLARTQFWTDSTIALQYVKNEEKQLHFRSQQGDGDPQQVHGWWLAPCTHWGELADDASRGILAEPKV